MKDPSHSLSNRFILLLSLWAGLATGTLEVLIQLFRKFGLHQLIGLGLDFIWMAPLADMLIFLAVGLVYIPYARRFTRLNNIRVLVFVLAFLSAFSVILYIPIDWYARDILSLGIAIALANAINPPGERVERLLRQTSLVLILIVFLSGVGLRTYSWMKEQQALANLPVAAPGSPNVLLIVMDTVRAQNLSLYGYERDTTPNLNKLARDGVVFETAFSTAPWTLPSHASIFTGHWPHEMTADRETPLDDTYPTLAQFLQGYGYQTAGFVGNNTMVTYELGMDRGFIHFEDFDTSAGQIFISTSIGRALGCWRLLGPGCAFRQLIGSYQELGRKSDQEVSAEALDWISKRSAAPYFMFINYYDAHSPYLPPEPFSTTFDPERPWRSKVFQTGVLWDGSPEDTRREVNNYDELILWLDHELGVFLDQMRMQGYLENTLVVITSDHGEEFQEHGVIGHGDSLYRQSVQVPLLLIFPDHLPAGRRVQTPVSLRNIPATVLDLIGTN